VKPEELRNRLEGVAVVMTTAFTSDFEVDEEGIRAHTRFMIDNGIKNGTGVLVPTASTGEFPMLSEEEQKRIIRIVKEEAGDEVPVVAGCCHTSTLTAIRMAHNAQEAKADGLMISPPYYWKPSEQTILAHFKAIAGETDLGIMAYNNWFATQIDIPLKTMIQLAEIPNIIAAKENTPDLTKFGKVVDAVGDKMAIFNGAGITREPACAVMGASGFVSGMASLIPQANVDIYLAHKAGDYAKARKLCQKLVPLTDLLAGGKGGLENIARLKAVMSIAGIPAGPARPPAIPPDEETKAQLKQALEAV